MRATWAEIDLEAVAHNVEQLRRMVEPAELCAVVKADGYGHGALEVAKVAVSAGASSLAVALVEEGAHLREGGLDGPILLLSEPPIESTDEVVRLGLEPTVYSVEVIDSLAHQADLARSEVPVHLKIDTGMRRVGVQPDAAVVVAKAIDAQPSLRLASVWTHCAVADEPANSFTGEQLLRLEAAVEAIEGAGISVPIRHAANSAVALAFPAGRLDRVRCGITVYGLAPSEALEGLAPLRPAMQLKSRVSWVKEVAAGEALSYGHHYRVQRPSVIATVPIGYADGLRRTLGSAGGEVLIGGRRRPIAGSVTMDQIVVDCGDDHEVAIGDEVVLIGRQGNAEVSVREWADRIGTIPYEVVCGISPRVPRRYLHPTAASEARTPATGGSGV